MNGVASGQVTFRFRGYVTTYRCVAGKNAADLERALGFGAGSLGAGYALYQLCEQINLEDFEWKDRTAYSAGWHYDPSIQEYVQRSDELRAQLGRESSWSESATDLKIEAFMELQVKRLNVRSGPDRIVKVLPNKAGDRYPDSRLRNVPQWKLKCLKSFAPVSFS